VPVAGHFRWMAYIATKAATTGGKGPQDQLGRLVLVPGPDARLRAELRVTGSQTGMTSWIQGADIC